MSFLSAVLLCPDNASDAFYKSRPYAPVKSSDYGHSAGVGPGLDRELGSRGGPAPSFVASSRAPFSAFLEFFFLGARP